MPTSRHAHPVDRHRLASALGRTGRGKCIEESIGGRVIHLALEAEDRADRRKQCEEVERFVAKQFVEDEGAFDLRTPIRPVADSSVFELDETVVQRSGRVDHAMDRAEPPACLGDHGAHPLAVGDIGGTDEHRPARRLAVLDSSDLLADGVVFLVRLEPVLPFASGGQGDFGRPAPGLP